MAGEELLTVTLLALASIVISIFVAVILKKRMSGLADVVGYLEQKLVGMEEVNDMRNNKIMEISNILNETDKIVPVEKVVSKPVEAPKEVVKPVEQPKKVESAETDRIAENKATVTAIINLQTEMLKELEKLKL
ncbi:hypothetical protein KKC87_04495 [Patescibacteria group bacterium]|nr:hypothetical protein [Patescibacteria group bacterium]